MSPSPGFRGMDERLSRWPATEATGELFDGIVQRLHLRLKTPQAFLDPCSPGIAP